MKFKMKNIGLIDKAEINLTNITCVCGMNNTGKTYVTYAIYGFLSRFHNIACNVILRRLLKVGITNGVIDLDDVFSDGVTGFLEEMSSDYIDVLSDVFGTENIVKENTEFSVCSDNIFFDYKSFEMQRLVEPKTKNKTGSINIVKLPETSMVEFVVDSDVKNEKLDIRSFAGFIIQALSLNVISKMVPSIYIASAERTGAAIFRDELDFAKLRLFDLIKGNKEKKDISEALLSEAIGGNYSYAWPIEHNVDFVRKIESIYKDVGGVSRDHPDIVNDFENIIGGSYKVVKDVLVYQSSSTGKPKFAMSESSSSVRALLDIGFYIKCKLNSGDILMIDEPELNLHPKNQRLFARLLAKLSNYGVKIFITTHSDYVIKELNILMMLSRSPNVEKISEQYGYSYDSFIDFESIKVYVTDKKRVARKNINTLSEAKILPDLGIELPTFDNSIEEMSNIQSDLYFGG